MLKSYVALFLGAVALSRPARAADFLTGQAARAVVGQPFFNGQVFGTSNTILGGAGGLAFAAGTLMVADSNRLGLLPNNNRVLLFPFIQQTVLPFDAEIPPYSGRCPVCGGQAITVVGQSSFLGAGATPLTQSSLSLPTGVASDGTIMAVADTSNNRVLIWKSIPTVIGQPADVVLGQPNFTTLGPLAVTASAFRGPQGVWIQNGRLFVADTQNNRILIWNSIPTQNNQPADLVLGQPNFTTAPQLNLINQALPAAANIMLSPTSVTSDGTRLYVSDLGFNRVLIWNSLPTTTQQPADVEIGQKDFTQSISNDTPNVCASNGTDSSGNPTYPRRCGATLSFPRFALSDGKRLFIADGGNDRVLVFNTIPTVNVAKADVILGEPDEFSDVYSTTDQETISSADVTPTPTSLAWDPQNQNLYVADPTNYRILVFSPAQPNLPVNSIVNAASLAVFAVGSVVFGGTVTAGNTVTVTINGTAYAYSIKSTDTLETIATGVAALVNAGAGDPNVFAREESGFATLNLISRNPGVAANAITLATTTSSGATVTAVASGSALRGGGSAGIIAPGSLVVMRGANLADAAVSAAPDGVTFPDVLPFSLGGVELYFDGIRAPLFSVSPTEIRAQFPFMVAGANSVSAWVRTLHVDGTVTVTTAVNVPVEDQNPGIFADPTPGAAEPRRATAMHASSFATGTVSVDGAIQAGDTGTITIGGSSYLYTVAKGDTLYTVRDQFIALINADPNSPVVASAASAFTRIRLQSKVPGPDGNGTPLAASIATVSTNTAGAQLLLTATNTALCCANSAGTPVTPENPAIPGETINIYATGLGLVCASPVVSVVDNFGNFIGYCTASPDPALSAIVDGAKFTGPALNSPLGILSSLINGATGLVVNASLMPGQIGIYQVTLEISPGTQPNLQAQATISQGVNTSNIVTIPIGTAPPQ